MAFPAGVTRAKARLRDKGERQEVEMREFGLPKGLLIPRFYREFIVQQTNCITCDVEGLAKAIREDRPWACPSKDRVPIKRGSKWCTTETQGTTGSIVVREGRDGKPGVINMMAQFGPGKPRLGRSSGDDARQRRQWFWQCLGRIESRKPRIKQLAFPENIGCGLAGGDWSTYKEMIRTFARRNRDIKVDIIQFLNVDDSESDSSDPSDWTDQDGTPDPDDDDQDREEEQDPEGEVDDENNQQHGHRID